MKRKLILGLVAAFAVFALTACAEAIEQESTEQMMEQTNSKEESAENLGEKTSDTPDSEQDSFQLTLENLPVLDGATANEPYYEGVIAKMLGVDSDTAKKNILCSTTNEAYQNLIDGIADMIFVSYPSKAQLERAKEAGVEFEYHQILTGAFVFFVNKDNPVDCLSIEQLQGIYRGEITNWKEVGGNDEPITAFQREEGSGSQNGLYRYLLPKEEVMQAPAEYYYNTMEGIVSAFGNADYDNSVSAIGYSYYYYVANMKYNDQIKLIALEGIEPNNETIGNGTYPFCNPTLAVVRKGMDQEHPVYGIIEWIMSDEGAKLAEELGYVANRSGKDSNL